MIAQEFSTLGMSAYKAAGATYIVESESKNIDTTNYYIAGSLTILAVSSTQIIAYSESINQVENPNITFKKLWDGEDDTYNMWSMGKVRTIQRIVTIAQIGSEPTAPGRYTAPPSPHCPGAPST